MLNNFLKYVFNISVMLLKAIYLGQLRTPTASLIQGNISTCILARKILKYKKRKIQNRSICSKVPTDDCFAGLLLGDCALLHFIVSKGNKELKLHYSTNLIGIDFICAFVFHKIYLKFVE